MSSSYIGASYLASAAAPADAELALEADAPFDVDGTVPWGSAAAAGAYLIERAPGQRRTAEAGADGEQRAAQQPRKGQQLAEPQPVAPQLAEPQPIAPQSVAMQPVGPQPVAMQPVGSQPVGPQPVEMQPVGPQPAEMQPIEMQPAERQPAEGQPAEPARVSLEGELVAVLAAPVEGSVAAAYQRKEVALRAVLARLPAAECRVLAARLRCVCPGDPLASLFGRMTAERRGRLLAYLDDARRREAVRAASEPRAKAGAAAAALVAPAPGASASMAGPSALMLGTAP